jgi:hypothetical protein
MEPDLQTSVLIECLDAIDKLALVGKARLESGADGDDVLWESLEDVFMATKDVIVAAEYLVEFGLVTR